LNKIDIPEAIRNAPLTAPIHQDRHDSVHAWLCKLSSISSQYKHTLNCTLMSFIVHTTLEHTVGESDCYILSNDVHSVCVYKDVVIDISENLYVTHFDWRVQTRPQHYVSIVPDRPDRLDPESRMHLCYNSCATLAFRLVGQSLRIRRD
jgi:hypothetical protein